MTDQERFQRAARVFLARLPILYGTDAPKVLRQVADELECLEEERLGDGAHEARRIL